MKISEIITDKYKLRIEPNVYYDLLADVREAEEEQEPICPSAGVDCEDCPAYEKKSEWEHDHEILKAYSDGANEVLDEIRAEIEEQVLESLSDGGDDWFTAEKVNECLEIIDKYKAEGSE